MKKEDIAKIPILQFGKYKGKRIDQVPMSYLRWMLGQKFDKELMEYAKKKVETNKTVKDNLDVTRHAIDKFSLNFIDTWDRKMGLGSYVTMKALEANEKGKDISKHRHADDQRIMEWEGIKYVFNQDSTMLVLITIM